MNKKSSQTQEQLKAAWMEVVDEIQRDRLPQEFGGQLTATIWNEADLREHFLQALIGRGDIPVEDIHVEATGFGVGPVDLAFVDGDACRKAREGGSAAMNAVRPYAALEFFVLQAHGPRGAYGADKLQSLLAKLETLSTKYPDALLIALGIVRNEELTRAPALPEGVVLWNEFVSWG